MTWYITTDSEGTFLRQRRMLHRNVISGHLKNPKHPQSLHQDVPCPEERATRKIQLDRRAKLRLQLSTSQLDSTSTVLAGTIYHHQNWSWKRNHSDHSLQWSPEILGRNAWRLTFTRWKETSARHKPIIKATVATDEGERRRKSYQMIGSTYASNYGTKRNTGTNWPR